MSYDAVALSAKDLSAGTVFIEQTLIDHFPWVSANVTYPQGKSVAPASKIKEIEGTTVGLIGLTGEGLTPPDDFLITDWRLAISAQIKNLNSNCDILVVLSTLSETDNRALSKEFKEVDIVITTTASNRNLQPKHLHNTLFAQTESRGKYLGTIEFAWKGEDNWHQKQPQSLQKLQKRLAAVDSQLKAFQRLEEEGKSVSSKKIARMTSYRRSIAEQIEAEEAAGDSDPNQVGKTENNYTSSFIPITPTTTANNVADIVRSAKEEISRLQ